MTSISADDTILLLGALSFAMIVVGAVIGVMFVWGQDEKVPE